MPETRARPLHVFLTAQLANPLILILLAAAVVAAIVGHTTDVAFILGVVAINTVVGGVQEWRAERGLHALKRLLRTRARVIREGETRTIDAAGLVPGDVVRVESGDRIPADVRLLRSQGILVDESLLTGESAGVEKDASWIAESPAPAADRHNILHAGTTALRGRATGVVVATGMATEVGRVARAVTGARAGEAPLARRLARFTRAVAIAVPFASALLIVLGLARGEPWFDLFFAGVALAVAAIPEGLPVALTIALAVAATRMAHRQVIVRRLVAVEALGSCTVIFTDKTGTLTVNALTVRELFLPSGARVTVTGEGFTPEGHLMLAPGNAPVMPPEVPGLEDALVAGILCNEATLEHAGDTWVHTGDPTDVALLVAAAKGRVDEGAWRMRAPEVGALPFEPENRFAATMHDVDGRVLTVVKGAPERVLAMCAPGTDPDTWQAESQAMAARGLRVLAIARKREDAAEAPRSDGFHDLEPVALVGMLDPPRIGVRESIRTAGHAGVRVAMITGDHSETARAIAHDLGIADASAGVVTGARVSRADDAALEGLVDECAVFARMSPDDKYRVVEAAKRRGHFVAVTGDGVNDAPALRAANFGVAMGAGGTDVARDASDIVLADDDFTSIVNGIEEGRIAYANVRKVVFLLVSTGAAEIVLILLGAASGLPLALLPAQLLWLNLVTNGIQHVALALEPGEPGIMRRPPRDPDERIFNRHMIERTVLGAFVMGGLAFATFAFLLRSGWAIEEARNATLLLMVLFENVHLGIARTETGTALTYNPLRSPLLLAAAVGAQLIHVAAMFFPPTQAVLGIGPVGLDLWGALLALALLDVVAFEAHAWVTRHRHPPPAGETPT